jgi:hypothetical protein
MDMIHLLYQHKFQYKHREQENLIIKLIFLNHRILFKNQNWEKIKVLILRKQVNLAWNIKVLEKANYNLNLKHQKINLIMYNLVSTLENSEIRKKNQRLVLIYMIES